MALAVFFIVLTVESLLAGSLLTSIVWREKRLWPRFVLGGSLFIAGSAFALWGVFTLSWHATARLKAKVITATAVMIGLYVARLVMLRKFFQL